MIFLDIPFRLTVMEAIWQLVLQNMMMEGTKPGWFVCSHMYQELILGIKLGMILKDRAVMIMPGFLYLCPAMVVVWQLVCLNMTERKEKLEFTITTVVLLIGTSWALTSLGQPVMTIWEHQYHFQMLEHALPLGFLTMMEKLAKLKYMIMMEQVLGPKLAAT